MRAIWGISLAMVLAGCQAEVAQTRQALSGQPPVVTGWLLNVWRVADLNGGGAPPDKVRVVFIGALEGGMLSGNAGCNDMFGQWRDMDGEFKIGPIETKNKVCNKSVMAIETQLLSVLQAANNRIFNSNGTVTLTTPDGRRVTLRPDRP